MHFIHTGLAASSEKNADDFYSAILGLEKSSPKNLDRDLSLAIFNIDCELLLLHYQSGTTDFEIIIYQGYSAPKIQIAHSCIQVNSKESIVKKCRGAGLKVIEVPKGSGVITFVSDYDGNLFELKE